jgi:hypothetical protein
MIYVIILGIADLPVAIRIPVGALPGQADVFRTQLNRHQTSNQWVIGMAWIKTINEDDAQGVLKTYYDKYGDPSSGVDEILKIHSLNPDSLRHHYEMYKHLMAGRSGLSRMQREMIAVVVSKINACHY